jgi:opacity protein-like surface antigen
MRLKVFAVFASMVMYLSAVEAYAQVVPSANSSNVGHLPIQFGACFSNFKTSAGHGTLNGGTLWVDYVPGFLHGVGVEVEARDLRIQSAKTQPIWQIDEAQGGILYSWRHFEKVQPYAKALWGYGNVDHTFYNFKGHDSRSITVLGGGLEYRIARVIRTRADYEYQFWPDFWKYTTQPQSLTPSGFTFGVLYDIGASDSR